MVEVWVVKCACLLRGVEGGDYNSKITGRVGDIYHCATDNVQ